MSDEMIEQALKETGIMHGTANLQVFAVARGAGVSSAEPDRYCTSYKIKIRGYQPGCSR